MLTVPSAGIWVGRDRSSSITSIPNGDPIHQPPSIDPAAMADEEKVGARRGSSLPSGWRSSSPMTARDLRVGDVFVKIDADQTRTDVEVEAIGGRPP